MNNNRIPVHPLQSFAWGKFRKLTGVKVVRKNSIQVTIHPLVKTNLNIGYFPKGKKPTKSQLKILRKIGKENNCIFIKLEPNILIENKKNNELKKIKQTLKDNNCKKGRPLFTKYSFQLNLEKSEEELLKNMHSKTRYNIRLAKRKAVKIKEDNSKKNFDEFLNLLFKETVKRQKFYAHNREYFEKMWKVLKPAGISRLIKASYKGETLAIFMIFVFDNIIYYPYGASTRKYKKMMGANLLMWEVIKLGKKLSCKKFDMWGSLGRNADKNDPWYGFHYFKKGYGGNLVEFLGTYDLIIMPKLYPIYRIMEKIRWLVLRLKAKVK